MRKFVVLLPVIGCLFVFKSMQAQGYQALHGSSFTGSTAVFNNPASSANSAYKWDLTLFSAQFKLSTDAAYISYTGGVDVKATEGYKTRYAHANTDLSLFNFLYKPDNNKAFTFGLRVRNYLHSKSEAFNYVDSMSSLHNFLLSNINTPSLSAFVTESGWAEAYLNYSQVLAETDHSRLTGGITLQIMKGLAGAFVRADKISYLVNKSATDTSFTFTNGGGSMAYSAGLAENSLSGFLKSTLTKPAISLGIEYLLYGDDVPFKNTFNYDWKIGASLMDFGANAFVPSSNSTQANSPNPALTDADLINKFNGVSNAQTLKDTLGTIFINHSDITDNFTISNPTRLIINVDRNFGNHFFVNGELSVNFYSTASYTKIHTRELNLLTITPRWETIGLGAYLPIQYTTQGQLWIGAAVKLGPLVVGFHNFGVLKNQAKLNGGGYVLLSIHPFNKRKILTKQDCPVY